MDLKHAARDTFVCRTNLYSCSADQENFKRSVESVWLEIPELAAEFPLDALSPM